MKEGFTLIELIFTIVIIGVLASVAIPKFSGLSDSSKIAAELSTASSVQIAIDACHGEWVINESSFTCGNIKSDTADFDNNTGYPIDLGNSLDKILKVGVTKWKKNGDRYYGPASNDLDADNIPVKNCKNSKPCDKTYWFYDKSNGTFTLTSE